MQNLDEGIQFPQNLIKNLIDKSNEKKKQATKDIEGIVKINMDNENIGQIKKIVHNFRDEYIFSQQQNLKKAGLLAFSAISIAVSSDEKISVYLVSDLLDPLLISLRDTDAKIRLAACESIYNVVKSLREISLLHFNEIFKSLVQSICDIDEDVKKGSQALDRILKDIITESQPNGKYFNLNDVMPIFQDKLKATNPTIRLMLINWINVFDTLPNVNLLKFLPNILYDLFNMLTDKNNDIRNAADQCLMEFLKEIREQTTRRNDVIDGQIMDILIVICNKKIDNFAKLNAIIWIYDYLIILLQEISNQKENDECKLQKIIIPKIPNILEPILFLLSYQEEEIKKAAQKTNDLLLKIMEKNQEKESIQFMNVLPLLQDMLDQAKINTVISALIWMKQLLIIYPKQLMPVFDDIILKLIEKLQDSQESITSKVMDVLGIICLDENNFEKVIQKILIVFKQNKDILENKCDIILQKICEILGPQKVYMTLAESLRSYKDDVRFINQVVNTANYFLITYESLKEFRLQLKNYKYNQDNIKQNEEMFINLYSTWIYNPVATITLCFLCEEYELAYYIITNYCLTEMDEETLTQISRLVFLIESPIFVNLRLQLLESYKYPYLLHCLQGLMMLLPQGKAFSLLEQRLGNIKVLEKPTVNPKYQSIFDQKIYLQINLEEMIHLFDKHKHTIYSNLNKKNQYK